jgi:hypothetical protein
LPGRFDDQHAFIWATMLRRIDTLAADIAGLDTRIEAMIAPFAQAVAKLDEITGADVPPQMIDSIDALGGKGNVGEGLDALSVHNGR